MTETCERESKEEDACHDEKRCVGRYVGELYTCSRHTNSGMDDVVKLTILQT